MITNRARFAAFITTVVGTLFLSFGLGSMLGLPGVYVAVAVGFFVLSVITAVQERF